MFIVQRKENNKPNMHFRMHEFGIHYYESAEYFTFVTTVAGNKNHYRKRQIEAAERAAELYVAVIYTFVADCRWVIQSSQIKECPLTVQDIYVAISIWGKDIFDLKGKTNSNKTI